MLSFTPVTKQTFPPHINWLLLLSSILLLLSLPGLYARQAGPAGWTGLIGYTLLQAGILLIVVISAAPLLYSSVREGPGESLAAFCLGIALTLGLLMTGMATLRAGVYSRWPGILLLAATAGFCFDFFVAEFLPPIAGQAGNATFGLLLALALTWMGYSAATDSAQEQDKRQRIGIKGKLPL